MAIFLPSLVQNCGGGHCVSSREQEVCSSNPREKGRTTMATFLLSSVKSREGGHGLCHHFLETSGTGLRVLKGKGLLALRGKGA